MKKNILISWILEDIWTNLVKWLRDNYNIYWLSSSDVKSGEISHFFCDLTQTEKIQEFINNIKNQKIVFDWIIFNTWINFSQNKNTNNNIRLLQIILYSPIYLISNLLDNIKDNGKILFLCGWDCDKSIHKAVKLWLKGFESALWKRLKNIEIQIVNLKINKHDLRNYDIFSLLNYKETKLNSILSKIKKTLTLK